jgi:hypothetical protein
MKVMSNSTAKRNQRVTAPLRRIQGQVPAIERFLVEDPDGIHHFLRRRQSALASQSPRREVSAWLTSEHQNHYRFRPTPG